MHPSSCPACAGEAPPPVFTNRLRFRAGLELSAWLCRACGHRWLPTGPEVQRQIEQVYGPHYTGFRVDERFKRVVRRELDQRLARVVAPPARLLDVGCGNGEFLMLARDAGYAAQGIDVSATSSALCRERGLAVVDGDFLTHELGHDFGLITMWDVMEHLRSPADFVERARRLLRPDGALLLKIPSKGALNFLILRGLPRRGGTLLGAPNHIQFFNERSLALLLARTGFRQLIWFEHQRFRERPATRDPRKLAGRAFSRVMARAASDQNLYLLALKRPIDGEAARALRPRRVETPSVSSASLGG